MKGEPDIIQTYEARYKETLSELKDLAEGFGKSDNYRGRELRANRR